MSKVAHWIKRFQLSSRSNVPTCLSLSDLVQRPRFIALSVKVSRAWTTNYEKEYSVSSFFVDLEGSSERGGNSGNPEIRPTMKVRSYPGRAVLEDPELLLDPDATRGRAMELLYEASWRECGVNWASNARSKPPSREDEYRQPYAEVISQLEGVLDGSRVDSSVRENCESRRSSNSSTTDSESSELNQTGNSQSGFLIPRPRLIVPVHTYARRRRTGAPPPARRRHIREGIPTPIFCHSLSKTIFAWWCHLSRSSLQTVGKFLFSLIAIKLVSIM